MLGSDLSLWVAALVAATFLLAGVVKGVVGLGLPTVAIGLLTLVMTPAQAIVILFLPTLVTNIWQLAIGRNLWPLFRRLWPMLALIFAGAFAGGRLLTGGNDWPSIALGIVLILYAAIGLANVKFQVSSRQETWLTPLIGLINGVVAAATGVFAVPAVPYLTALGLDKDDLVQALGLHFTACMLALAIILARENAFAWSATATSLIGLVTALIGMAIGQIIRTRVNARTFRICFFLGIAALGFHLASRQFL